MPVLLSEYDDFLKKFRSESQDPVLSYWTDVIHLLRWDVTPLVEKRFMGGFIWWGVWAVLKVFSPRSGLPANDGKKTGAPLTGYILLPTPAHKGTLMPLIERADPGTIRIFGEDSGIPDLPQTPLDFPSNLGMLGIRHRLQALLRAIRNHRKIARIIPRCIPAGQHLPPAFHLRLIEQIFAMEIGLARMRHHETPLQSLYISYELAPESKALVLWARETGADVIHVIHGQRLPTYQLTFATDLVLLSKIDEEWFRSRVSPSVRIHSNGHPRLEKIRKLTPPPSKDGRTLPRIAFFSQPAEGDYTPERRDADFKILLGLIGKAEVRIRLHPRESKDQALLALERVGATVFRISDEGLEQDLIWCDAIASSWSTVSMEAAACGRGVFWNCSAPERYDVPQQIRESGIGALIQDPAQWQPHLDHWQADGWTDQVLTPESRLRALGLIGDDEKSWMQHLKTA